MCVYIMSSYPSLTLALTKDMIAKPWLYDKYLTVDLSSSKIKMTVHVSPTLRFVHFFFWSMAINVAASRSDNQL